MRTMLAILALLGPVIVGSVVHHRIYEPNFWQRRSFWSRGKLIALSCTALVTYFLVSYGAEAVMGWGVKKDVSFLILGFGTGVVVFSRALLGRVGPAFTDLTDEYGSILGWLLITAGVALIVVYSSIR